MMGARLDPRTMAGRLPADEQAALMDQVEDRWQDWANCGKREPEIFFATKATGEDQLAVARAICHPCGVRRSCLAYALLTSQKGMWGGTTEDERSDILRDIKARANLREALST